MSTEWYCRIDGTVYGPESEEQLRKMARSGRLTRKDFIREGATGDWVSVVQAKGLFDGAEDDGTGDRSSRSLTTDPASNRSSALPVIIPALVLYLTAFVLPSIPNRDGWSPGFVAFLLGLFALIGGVPIWLANPAFWVGSLLAIYRRWMSAALAGTAAVILALIVPDYKDMRVSSFGFGYFFWIASFVWLAGGSVVMASRSGK